MRLKGRYYPKSLKRHRGHNMPFTSKAQARYMYAVHPEIAKEFEKKTLSIKALPEHVKKKKKDGESKTA